MRLTHGHTHAGGVSPTYQTWAMMVQRCTNPKRSNYRYYGGRGIGFCARWELFVNFLADMGERPEGMTLDRIDNDDDYGPENCRWVPAGQNIARINGDKTHCLNGHALTEDNVYVKAGGGRNCKKCAKRRAAEYKRKKRTDQATTRQ